MTTWTLIDAWGAAIRSLDVEVEGPKSITLESGVTLTADLFVRDFGNLRGTLVLTDASQAERQRADAEAAGFSQVVVDPPASGRALGGFEMAPVLRGWGWNGSEKGRPEWA